MRNLDKAPRWQLQDAKNRLSELVSEAQRQGPQVVTCRGTEVVVVVSFAEFERSLKKEPATSLVDVLLAAPKVRGGLRVDRARDPGRKVELE
jgi:antitoxin Phd